MISKTYGVLVLDRCSKVERRATRKIIHYCVPTNAKINNTKTNIKNTDLKIDD